MTVTHDNMISVEECVWNVFGYTPSEVHRFPSAAGLASFALTNLLMITLLRVPTKGWSYVIILNLTTVCWFRSLVSVFVHAIVPAFYDGLTPKSCTVIGYLHKLISAYQVEAITLLSIERYVLAKYSKLGISVERSHYILYIVLCWLFAVFYSLTPLFGFGTYLGNWGELNTFSYAREKSSEWKSGCEAISFLIVNAILQLMQSVKPLILTTYMLYWTCKIEKTCYIEELKHRADKIMTQSTIWMSVISAFCWMPTFLCYLIILYQVTLKCTEDRPVWLVMYGSLGFEIAPAATVLTIIATNEYIRRNVISWFSKKQVHSKTD